LLPWQGRALSSHTADARLRLGWDARGLPLWIQVDDPTPHESGNANLWNGDCVELFPTHAASGTSTQIMLTSGRHPDFPGPRVRIQRLKADLAVHGYG